MGASLALFAERGFHGTRVPEIAGRAGVAVGTIYRYFPTKEALVNAVYRDRKQAFAAAMALAVDPAAAPRDQAGALWRASVGWAQANSAAFRFLELHHHADYLDADSRAATDQTQAVLRAQLDDARQAGAVRSDLSVDVLVALLSGALAGFVREVDAGGLGADRGTIDAAGAAVWRLVAR